MSELTKKDEYKPTTAELKMLEVLSDPHSFRLSITDKCEQAGISRTYYYEIMQKPEFVNLISKTALDLARQRALDLVNASYKAALGTSFQDRQMLLEMGDIIKTKDKGDRILVIPILGSQSIKEVIDVPSNDSN